MGNRKRWASVMSVVLALSAIWIWISSVPASATTAGEIPSPHEGFIAPEFSLGSLEGAEYNLSDLRGEVVVLNLWASWCPPCRAEMPAMQRVYEAHREQGLEILAVNTTYQDSVAAAQAFAEEFGLSFPLLLDRDGSVGSAYQLRALPTTFFIDRQGIIRRVILGGPISEATLQVEVETLLAEVP
jgi:peroxiredoxin